MSNKDRERANYEARLESTPICEKCGSQILGLFVEFHSCSGSYDKKPELPLKQINPNRKGKDPKSKKCDEGNERLKEFNKRIKKTKKEHKREIRRFEELQHQDSIPLDGSQSHRAGFPLVKREPILESDKVGDIKKSNLSGENLEVPNEFENSLEEGKGEKMNLPGEDIDNVEMQEGLMKDIIEQENQNKQLRACDVEMRDLKDKDEERQDYNHNYPNLPPTHSIHPQESYQYAASLIPESSSSISENPPHMISPCVPCVDVVQIPHESQNKELGEKDEKKKEKKPNIFKRIYRRIF